MENIIVERVYIDNSYLSKINTRNHQKDPNDQEILELDYETEFKKTNLMNYAKLINYPIGWSYTFTDDELVILIKYASDYLKNYLSMVDMQPIVDRFSQNWVEGTWFCRFNSKSPKDGVPNYPITCARDVINKIITSKRAWNCMVSFQKNCKAIFIGKGPFIENCFCNFL